MRLTVFLSIPIDIKYWSKSPYQHVYYVTWELYGCTKIYIYSVKNNNQNVGSVRFILWWPTDYILLLQSRWVIKFDIFSYQH